jgi:hypothetical protein
MEKEVKFIVTFTVPVSIKATKGVTPDPIELQVALTQTAIKRINETSIVPQIEVSYEVVSEDTAGQNQVSGNNSQGPVVDNHVGAVEGKDTDHNEKVSGDELGQSKCNDSAEASNIGNAGQDRKEDEGGVQRNSSKKERYHSSGKS